MKKSKLDHGKDVGLKASEEPPINTWNFSHSAAENVHHKDLGVAELKWPEERKRNASQESAIISEKELQQGRVYTKAPPYKPVFRSSHSGRASTFVESESPCDGTTQTATKDCSVKRNLNTTVESAECVFTGPNFWPLLSDEMILSIFEFLPKLSVVRCARVCNHWKRLAYDESLWRRADMNHAKLSSGVLGKVINRGSRVLRIAKAQVLSPLFDESQMTSFEDVVPLSPVSPSDSLLNLRYLDATRCTFEGDTLLCLLMHAKRLKCISLESCNLSLGIMRALSACQGLEVLNLAMCSGITVPGIIALVKGCTRLKQLNLGWTNLSRESVKQVVRSLPDLRQLNLSGCQTSATDVDIEILLTKCPQLVCLDISDCRLLTQRSLEAVIKQSKIQQLSMSRCYMVTPVTFSWCARMKSLTKLNVYDLIDADGIKLLRKRLPRIAVNTCMFSTIARPTTSLYTGKIWDMRC